MLHRYHATPVIITLSMPTSRLSHGSSYGLTTGSCTGTCSGNIHQLKSIDMFSSNSVLFQLDITVQKALRVLHSSRVCQVIGEQQHSLHQRVRANGTLTLLR